MIITLYKKSKRGRMSYFCLHNHQGSLFAPHTLTAITGKELNSGRETTHTFNSEEELEKKIEDLLVGKVGEGYRVLYSYAKKATLKKILKGLIKAS